MSIGRFETLRVGTHGVQVCIQFCSEGINFLLNFGLVKSFLFQFQLELQTLYLYFALTLVLKNGGIGLSVFWGCSIPGTRSIYCCFMRAQC